MKKYIVLVLFFFLIAGTVEGSTTYYVDATSGSDSATGTSQDTAWRTMKNINSSVFSAGDSILFKRGETWRERIVATSSGSYGSPIIFGAYGTGDKPKLLGSVNRSSVSDWTETAPNIWVLGNASVTGSELLQNPSFDIDTSNWYTYATAPSQVTYSHTTTSGEFDSPPGGIRVYCTTGGGTVQFYTQSINIESNTWYTLTFRAKASKSFITADGGAKLSKTSSPWTEYTSVNSSSNGITFTSSWKTYTVYYKTNVAASDARIRFRLDNMPTNSYFYIDTLSIKKSFKFPLLTDVGNIIFNNEAFCGVKVSNEVELTSQGKFWYDSANYVLKLYSTRNPAMYYTNIEIAYKGADTAIIFIGTKSYITVKDLDFRYSGFEGIVGYNSNNIIIEHNDFSYIGGGYITVGSRAGNGVEFWDSNHDTWVRYNRFDNIYDAATTTQGSAASNSKYNQYFHNNIITNSEYCFELWNRGAGSTMNNIYFENNVCANAGGGFGHSQRIGAPAHGNAIAMFESNAAATNVFIRNNIFYNCAESSVLLGSWFFTDIDNVTLDYNLYYQPSGDIVSWMAVTYTMAQWADYKSHLGREAHSPTPGDPLFVYEKNSNFHLQSNSPAIDKGTNVGLTRDFEGTPIYGTPDIGAYEFIKYPDPPTNFSVVK